VSAKSEQKKRSYEAIVASACSLLREKGIAGAKVADVMAGAGLTVGGFYAHFPSKEALVDEALRVTSSAMRASLFSRLESGGAERVLRRYLSAAHRDDAAQGCPFPSVVGEVGTHAGEHAPAVAQAVSALAEEVARVLPAEPAIAPRHLALGLVALMYGGLALARATRGSPLSDDVLRACRALGALAARPASGVSQKGETS